MLTGNYLFIIIEDYSNSIELLILSNFNYYYLNSIMINNDTEKLLTAIKNSVLIKYAQSLALDTPKDNIISMPTVNFFETYVYEQKAID